MRKILGLLFISMFFFVGCQQAPTKVYQQTPTQTKGDSSQISITEKTVIVDARPAFDYSVSHLNGSIPLRPEDFTQREAPFQGLLEQDHFSLTRRLARLGISPETPVVVVGRGPQGQGEEGRVAWTLRFLGVKNVRFAAINYFSLPLSTAEAPPKENAAIWKPELDESLHISRDDFVKVMMKPRADQQSPVLMDVRRSDEYLGKVPTTGIKNIPDIGAINVPWTQFFTTAGLADETVKSRLQSIGITPERPIYLISGKGIESAAVTLALRDLGYSKAANFAGGYQELVSKKLKASQK